jgi:aspartate carbamoyltransferase regulatory subunit
MREGVVTESSREQGTATIIYDKRGEVTCTGEWHMSVDREVRVSKIKDGTVIDHISAGYALDVVKILGITGHEKQVMTIAVNVPSKLMRVKDLVKIEGRALNRQEVNRIALVAPRATINFVKDYVVKEKLKVQLPKVIEDIVKCVNPTCVSNAAEPIEAKFYVESEEPLLLKCHYCGYILEEPDVLRQF